MAARPNGDVYVAIADGPNGAGGVVGLRDSDGDGRADQQTRFGNGGGNGIAWNGDYLYFAQNDRVVRYGFRAKNLGPAGGATTVVSDLPAQIEHVTKTIAFGGPNTMYVNIGSASNACQVQNRVPLSPGVDPCPELATRAGIWVGDPQRSGQSPANLARYASGLRNSVALAVHPGGALFAVQMDRDNLHDNWPGLFSIDDDARLPAEELIRVRDGADYGWPYCYFDGARGLKVLAPEYGGDGAVQGRCETKATPALALPAHWAPMSMLFYTASAFPAPYRGGAFIAFHGDYFWGARPRSDDPGYHVIFVPFAGESPTGAYQVFAAGFAGTTASSRQTAAHRATGLAVAPDGALLIADDVGGRIWRVVYRGP
jgi:glucose/arabinose dehydrogenase